MMNFFHKISFFVITFALMSCGAPKDYNVGQKTQMRIVDLQGKPHPVQMRTPELNIQALAAQGNLTEEKLATVPQKTAPQEPEIAKNKYSGSFADSIKETLDMPQAANTQKTNTAENVAVVAVAPNKARKQTIEYDLTTDAQDKSASMAPAKEVAAKKMKGLFVQAGSYSVMQHAKNSLEKISKTAGKNIAIEEAEINGKEVYRVLIGPFANKKKANAMIAKLEKSGHKAIIVRNK